MRRMKVVSVLIFVCMVSVLMLSSSVMANQSYMMVCKGGGDMKLTVDNRVYKIILDFKKAPQSATQHEPPPGYCAWVDRPLNASEPSSIYFYPIPDKLFDVLIAYPNSITVGGPKGTYGQLFNAVRSGQLFYVHCYNAGSYFKLTKFGP